MQGGVQQAPMSSLRGGTMFGMTNSATSRRGEMPGGLRPSFGREDTRRVETTVQREEHQAPANNGKRVINASAFMEKPVNLRRMSDVERDIYAPKSNHQSLTVGMIVQHDRFGVGEVQTTEGVGENAKATIRFQNAGVKTLLLKFAKLKVIG
jgi:hypothetical protein